MTNHRNRLEVISEQPDGAKMTIVIESDMLPPISLLEDMLKLFMKGALEQ